MAYSFGQLMLYVFDPQYRQGIARYNFFRDRGVVGQYSGTLGSHIVIARPARGKYMTGLWRMSQGPSGEKRWPLREMDGFKLCGDLSMRGLFWVLTWQRSTTVSSRWLALPCRCLELSQKANGMGRCPCKGLQRNEQYVPLQSPSIGQTQLTDLRLATSVEQYVNRTKYTD